MSAVSDDNSDDKLLSRVCDEDKPLTQFLEMPCVAHDQMTTDNVDEPAKGRGKGMKKPNRKAKQETAKLAQQLKRTGDRTT